MPSGMPSTSLPRTSVRPAEAGSRPDTSDNVVDLPHPVGPTTATNSPGRTVRFRLRTAVWMPPPVPGKRLVAFRSSMRDCVIASYSCEIG